MVSWMKNNRWLQLCIDMMRMQIHYKWGDAESMQRFDILSPHALSIVEYACSNGGRDFPPSDSLPFICNVLGFGYRYNGKYALSMDCYKKSLFLQENVLSKLSGIRATLYYNIAWLYDEMNDTDSALEWYLKDLAICEAVYGREGLSTAYTYDSIGSIYKKKGNYKKAMSYHKRALYIFEDKLGKNASDVAVVCGHIAAVYAEKHSYDMSLRWHQRDIKISETVLGTKHPDTATAYHNLGITYYQMGNYKKALIWLKKAIIIRYKILGKDHCSFVQSIRSASLAYVSIFGSTLSFSDWLRDTCGIDQSVIFSIVKSEPYTINAFRQGSHDR